MTWSCFFEGSGVGQKVIAFFLLPVSQARSPQKFGSQHRQEQAHLDRCATRRGVQGEEYDRVAPALHSSSFDIQHRSGGSHSIERKDFSVRKGGARGPISSPVPTVTGWEADAHAGDRRHVTSGFLVRSWVRSRLSCSLFSRKKGKKEKDSKSSEGQPSTSLRASMGYHIGSCSLRVGRVGSPSFPGPGLGLGLLRTFHGGNRNGVMRFSVFAAVIQMLQGREAVHSQITFRRPAYGDAGRGSPFGER